MLGFGFLGNRSRRYSTSYIPIVVRRSTAYIPIGVLAFSPEYVLYSS